MRINAGAETPSNAQRPENTARSNEVAGTKSSKDVEKGNEAVASDRVDLSAQARDIQRAREVAQGAPEVLEDKVEAARRAVQSGNLNLKGPDLAENLLQDSLPS